MNSDDVKQFFEEIARMTKDRECASCSQDGDDPNPNCENHEAFDMENDDAVETLHSIITTAREFVAKTPVLDSPCVCLLSEPHTLSTHGASPEWFEAHYWIPAPDSRD